MMEAGCTVVGGHSIGDEEIKFGYAVTGLIDPGKVIRNMGAKQGDVLVLTKPLGTGVIGTAVKRDAVEDSVVQAAIRWMIQLNRQASEIARGYEVHAMTDVTGFGILGHARMMAQGSGVTLEFDHSRVPAMGGAMDCIDRKMIPGGLVNNRKYLEPLVEFKETVPEPVRTLLFDPQTSGGLLISCRADQAAAMILEMQQQEIPAVAIGTVVEKDAVPLRVI